MIQPEWARLIGNQLACNTSVLRTQGLGMLQLCFQKHPNNGEDQDQQDCRHEDQNGTSHELLLISFGN